MKKLIEKDKKIRLQNFKLEQSHFTLKSIVQNLNLPMLIRWNAYLKLNKIGLSARKTAISARCVQSINKKNFNKNTKLSRHLYLKNLRFGNVYGVKKSVW